MKFWLSHLRRSKNGGINVGYRAYNPTTKQQSNHLIIGVNENVVRCEVGSGFSYFMQRPADYLELSVPLTAQTLADFRRHKV